jgi:hypothetical protein
MEVASLGSRATMRTKEGGKIRKSRVISRRGCDYTEVAKSNKKKPFSMNARIDEPYLGLINCSHNPCFLNQGIVSHA